MNKEIQQALNKINPSSPQFGTVDDLDLTTDGIRCLGFH